MTQSEHTARTRRAQALVDLVEKVRGGYRVRSARDSEVAYFVSKPNGQIVCTCSDFEEHAEDPSWRCKHIAAAIEANRLGRFDGRGRGQASKTADTEDPSPEKTGAPMGGFQGLPRTRSGEETTSLDSCGRCGRTFTTDELFPTNGPDGFSLLCWECLYATPAQADRETSATSTEEPPLTYPCICCGADGLTYKEVVPHAMNIERDEGTICLSCLADIREGRILERMGREGVYVFIHPSATSAQAGSTPAPGLDPGADSETIPAQSPCGRCGRFFPLARIEGEVCLECLRQEQAREGSGFKVHGSEVKTLNREPLNLEPYSLQPIYLPWPRRSPWRTRSWPLGEPSRSTQTRKVTLATAFSTSSMR